MGTGRKLLLADDSITIQKVVNLTFVDEGLEVTTVGNGDLAIEKIEELIPDIVLADVHMPGLNGYEVCEFAKRNERFRHIPVMLLVGSFEPFDEAEARRVGADDYLTKPFQSIRQLVSKVGALLGGKSVPDETPTKELDAHGVVQSEAQVENDAAQRSAPTEFSGAETLDPDSFSSDIADDAFADPSFDDAMIEATPAGDFNLDRTSKASRATSPLGSPDLEKAGANRNMPSAIHTQDTIRMQASDLVKESIPATGASANQSSRSSKTFAADDALLDLGDDQPQLAARGQEEFVLDIWDDAPVTAAVSSEDSAESPIVRYEGDVTELSAPSAGPIDEVVVEEAPFVHATPLDDAQSESVVVDPDVDVRAAPSSHEGLITLEQLSPEVIDAIARRAVEQLSEKVVEQIAWEVVPDLAERLIKRRLEQDGKL